VDPELALFDERDQTLKGDRIGFHRDAEDG
jgi:hypothetical protein